MVKMLLTTAYSPFNPIGLNHNPNDLMESRLCKGQDIFTLRSRYPQVALHYIAQNVSVPTLVLEYPTLDEFVTELKKGYDFVGITVTTIYFEKILHMVRLIRELSPETKIILGGFGVTCLTVPIEQIQELAKVPDYIIYGEGLRFMRELFGDPVDGPIKQKLPLVEVYAFGQTNMPQSSAIVVAGFGCNQACDFCSSSYFYGGKAIRIVTPKELYQHMRNNVQRDRHLVLNYICDEDFLSDKDFVLELGKYLQNDEKYGLKRLNYSTFASVKSLSQYEAKELAELGVATVWIGVESLYSDLEKRKGKDIREIFSSLQEYGISVTGSLIIGWDFQNPDNIWDDIRFFASLKPTFTQVSTLMPIPGTALWNRLLNEEKVIKVENIDWNKMNLYGPPTYYRHKNFEPQEIMDRVEDTYNLVYQETGPSLMKVLEIHLNGYRNFKNETTKFGKERAMYHKEYCNRLFPLTPVFKEYAPNKNIQGKVSEIEAMYLEEFGEPGLGFDIASSMFKKAARLEKEKGVGPERKLEQSESRRYEYNFDGNSKNIKINWNVKDNFKKFCRFGKYKAYDMLVHT